MKKLFALHLSAAWILPLTLLAGPPLRLDWGNLDTSASEQQRATQDLKKSARVTTVQRLSPRGTAPWLVQFNDVIREEWKEDLVKAGAEIRGYMPENGFLLLATPEQIKLIGEMQDVVYVGEFLPAYKKSKQVRRHLAKGGSETREYNVWLYRAEDMEAIAQEIAQVPGAAVTRVEALPGRALVRVHLPASAVETVTGWGEVEWVDPYLKPQLWNDIAVRSDMMNVSNIWNVLGLTGAGQTIAVCDTGLDSGNTSTIHQDFTGRVTGFGWTNGTYNASYSWADYDSHGSHVSGSVLGNGTMSTGKYRGVAYEANLIIQGANASLNGIPANLNTLFKQAFDNGARIHSDSWGYSDDGYYSPDSLYLDQFTWSNKTMLVLIAAGNQGIDANSDGVVDLDSIGSPGTAKNCLTVGAAESDRPEFSAYTWGSSWPADFPANPIKDDEISGPDDSINQGLAAFSSRGPCDDGRIKPDIVAPGTDIISTRSRRASDTGWGIAPNTNYLYMGGTSMATPLTAGAAALVRQWLIEDRGIASPSGPLVKALMINGSRNMSPGQYGTGSYREIPISRPNNMQGYGHVDLGNTLIVPTNQFLDLYDTNSLSTGYTNTFALNIGTTTGKFVLTMAYADYWGTVGSGKQLVNDLDLTVQKPSGGYLYANGRTSKDATNNVEMIEFVPDETGTYTVRVAASDVNSGGSQPYALVVRGYVTQIPSNQAPVLTPIGNQTVNWSNTLQFAVTATESDGDAVTLSVSNAPGGSTFGATNKNGTFTWANAGPVGVYTMTFYAVDKDGLDSETITVTVREGGTAEDLFISEYVEGSGSEKYIEIFNGTGESVDLSDYALILYANGATSHTASNVLSGTLADGDVKVYRNSSAALYSCDSLSAINFNGDDAVALWKCSSSSYVDIFGRIGEDPGSAWTSGSLTTVDKTLVRKSSVTEGVSANPGSGFPTLGSEWDMYDINTVSYLGDHDFDGGGTPDGTNLPVISYSPAGTNHSVTVSNLLTVTVTATDADGDEIVLVDVSLPSGASFPGDLGASPVSSDFTWTPTVTGTYVAVFEAEDNDGGVTSTIQIVVNPAPVGGTGTNLLVCDFSSGLPSGWTNIDWLANSPEQKWLFNNPKARTFNASSAGNGFAIMDSDYYGTGKSQAADMVSPVMDMSGATDVVVRFEHYFRNYSTNDWAGIWYNTDGSLTSYVFIATWDGADTANAATYVSNVSSLVSGHSQVRFGWYYQASYDWYWCVDDISITGIVASAGNDDDGDGIPNDWESQYSGTSTGLVASADDDEDDFTNYEEYLADTNPTDPDSVFMGIGAAVSLNQVLSFPGSTARMYSLYYRTNIISGPDWTPVVTEVAGTNTLMSITDTNKLDPVYYRLKVELLP
ncbi:MAG TPA: S8 family serine peptidase [Kiritimatiellia bacterium]|nr:S8 family serine peptidase [Kiritimatiellia bacterium]